MGEVTNIGGRRGSKGGGRKRGDQGGGHERVEPGHEQMTEDEEKLRLEAEAKDREDEEKRLAEVAEQLSFPIGGTPATTFQVQVTGPAVELPPDQAGKFQRDAEVELTVRGWVKQGREVTKEKGGRAYREAIVVVEEVEAK